MTIYQQWLDAKEQERQAIEARRLIEDQLIAKMDIPESLDGTKTTKAEGYTIKVTGRLTHKVDSEMAQELAAEAGISEHLSSLFRWKPEINMSAWKSADATITAALAPAITTKPGRPSFSIQPTEE